MAQGLLSLPNPQRVQRTELHPACPPSTPVGTAPGDTLPPALLPPTLVTDPAASPSSQLAQSPVPSPVNAQGPALCPMRDGCLSPPGGVGCLGTPRRLF